MSYGLHDDIHILRTPMIDWRSAMDNPDNNNLRMQFFWHRFGDDASDAGECGDLRIF